MHGRGPRGGVVGEAAGGCPAQPRLAQPATQGAAGGQGDAPKVSAQDDADQLGPPPRMLLAESQGLQDDGVGSVGAGGRLVIGRRGCLPAVALREAEQVVDCTQRQAKPMSQVVGREPPLLGSEEGLTDGDRDGTRHGR